MNLKVNLGKSQPMEVPPHVPGKLDKTPTSKLWKAVVLEVYKDQGDKTLTSKPWVV
jgi:hypothetical protein